MGGLRGGRVAGRMRYGAGELRGGLSAGCACCRADSELIALQFHETRACPANRPLQLASLYNFLKIIKTFQVSHSNAARQEIWDHHSPFWCVWVQVRLLLLVAAVDVAIAVAAVAMAVDVDYWAVMWRCF